MHTTPHSSVMLPPHQQRLYERCLHPTGTWNVFRPEDVEQSIPARFEQQAAQYSHCVAVTHHQTQLTYAELNHAANGVARLLLTRYGSSPEPVAALFEHSVSTVVALLGVLKAGKFYVPLDPTQPKARQEYVLQDTEARVLLTSEPYLSLAESYAGSARHIYSIDRLASAPPAANPALTIMPEAYAYIVYTSGSTGQPKGVIIDHRDVLHFAMLFTNAYHCSIEDRIALLTPLTFSGSAHPLYGALMNGARLCLFDLHHEGLGALASWLNQQAITIASISPSALRHFLAALPATLTFPSMRLLRPSADRSFKDDIALMKQHFAPHCLVRLGMGTSEVKTLCDYLLDLHTPLEREILPVGYALKDITILILDEAGQPLGANQVGEIAVKSRYMSPGYWRRPALTSAKFLPDPHGGPERIYLTGDIGLLESDGCLLYLGRKDLQVKIRGHLIALAEVEQALLELTSVKEAVVVAQASGATEQRLVAYVVPHSTPPPTVTALRCALAVTLPAHMLPDRFVFLAALPLNANGKVNKDALPVPDFTRPPLDTPFVPPHTPVEATLARIWAEVLGLEAVGIHDHFLELGGNSLQATQLITRVLIALRVQLSVRALFDAPTIADMALLIVQHQAEQASEADLERLLAEVEHASKASG